MSLAMWIGAVVLGGLATYALMLAFFWWSSRGDRHS